MVRIAGSGIYVPGKPISTVELAELTGLEFDADRLRNKLGISFRHIAHLRGIDETTADFAEQAVRSALDAASLEPEDIDLFICATDTPEFISPATAILLQGRLQGGERCAGSFDVAASCASFVQALDVAAAMLKADKTLRAAAVAGIYNMPAYLRPDDAFGYAIFADGAGAVILTVPDRIGRASGSAGTYSESVAALAAPRSSSRYIAGQMLTDGTQFDYIGVYSGGTRRPVTRTRLEAGEYGLQLLQRLPGDRNVKLWPGIIDRLLKKAGMELEQVDHFLFTQINRSVIEEVMGILGRSMDSTTTVMDRYGYTGSACIPMALHTAISEGRIVRGDTVITVASGAGLAVGANLFVF